MPIRRPVRRLPDRHQRHPDGEQLRRPDAGGVDDTFTPPATLTTTNAATNISTQLGRALSSMPRKTWRPTSRGGASSSPGPCRSARWCATSPNDGEYLNRSWLGYGGAISGNFFTWGRTI
jgi:hypothetical protein